MEWDGGNVEKCQKHGVSIAEIEGLFLGTLWVFPDVRHSEQEERFIGIGKTQKGRHVLMVFTFRVREGKTFVRPISARYMHGKEVERYEEEIAKTEQ
jgi:hypothetical protein